MGIVRRSMGTMMSRYTGRDRSGSMERNKGSSMGRESRNSHAISSMGNCMSVLNSLVRHLEKPSCYDEVLIQPARLRFQQYVSLAFISIIFLIDFIYLHLFIQLESQQGHPYHFLTFSFIFLFDRMPISHQDLSSFVLSLISIFITLPHFFFCFPLYVEHTKLEIGNQDRSIFSLALFFHVKG